MPGPVLRNHRLSIAYVLLAAGIGIGFFVLGTRLATESADRKSGVNGLVQQLCQQQVAGRKVGNERALVLREFIQSAATVRRQAALQARAEGDKDAYAFNQAAYESYIALLPRVTLLPPAVTCDS